MAALARRPRPGFEGAALARVVGASRDVRDSSGRSGLVSGDDPRSVNHRERERRVRPRPRVIAVLAVVHPAQHQRPPRREAGELEPPAGGAAGRAVRRRSRRRERPGNSRRERPGNRKRPGTFPRDPRDEGGRRRGRRRHDVQRDPPRGRVGARLIPDDARSIQQRERRAGSHRRFRVQSERESSTIRRRAHSHRDGSHHPRAGGTHRSPPVEVLLPEQRRRPAAGHGDDLQRPLAVCPGGAPRRRRRARSVHGGRDARERVGARGDGSDGDEAGRHAGRGCRGCPPQRRGRDGPPGALQRRLRSDGTSPPRPLSEALALVACLVVGDVRRLKRLVLVLVKDASVHRVHGPRVHLRVFVVVPHVHRDAHDGVAPRERRPRRRLDVRRRRFEDVEGTARPRPVRHLPPRPRVPYGDVRLGVARQRADAEKRRGRVGRRARISGRAPRRQRVRRDREDVLERQRVEGRVQDADVEVQRREVPRGVRIVHVRGRARDPARVHRGEPARASGVVAGRPLLIVLRPSRSTRTLSVRLDLLGSRREGQNVRQEYHEDGEGAAARPSPHPSSPFLPAPPLKCPLLASKPLQTRCVNNGGCRWLVSKQDFGTGFLLPPPWQRIGHACLHQFLTASSFRRLIRPRARQTHLVPRPTHPTRLA